MKATVILDYDANVCDSDRSNQYAVGDKLIWSIRSHVR
jgi:hypothetical protein